MGPTEQPVVEQPMSQMPTGTPEKRNKISPVLVIIIAVLLMVGIGVGAFVLISQDSDREECDNCLEEEPEPEKEKAEEPEEKEEEPEEKEPENPTTEDVSLSLREAFLKVRPSEREYNPTIIPGESSKSPNGKFERMTATLESNGFVLWFYRPTKTEEWNFATSGEGTRGINCNELEEKDWEIFAGFLCYKMNNNSDATTYTISENGI